MIKVYISGNRADVTEREPLTSGTVGKVINFAFTEDWHLLIKYAVSRAAAVALRLPISVIAASYRMRCWQSTAVPCA